MNEDLIAAIRNAIERGASLEQAVQSLINAGYSSSQVNEAASSISNSATSIIEQPNPKSLNKKQDILPRPVQDPMPKQTKDFEQSFDKGKLEQTDDSQNKTQKSAEPKDSARTARNIKLAIVLVITLMVLVAILGGAVYYKTQIMDWFNSNPFAF